MNMEQLMEQRRARIAQLTDQIQALAAGEDADVVVSAFISCFLQVTVCMPELRSVILENVDRMRSQIAAMGNLPPAQAEEAAFALADGHGFHAEDVSAEAAAEAKPVQH